MHISNVSSFVLSKSPVNVTFKVSAEGLERVQRLRALISQRGVVRKRGRKGKREGGREGEGWRKGVGRERRNAMGGKLHMDFDTVCT